MISTLLKQISHALGHHSALKIRSNLDEDSFVNHYIYWRKNQEWMWTSEDSQMFLAWSGWPVISQASKGIEPLSSLALFRYCQASTRAGKGEWWDFTAIEERSRFGHIGFPHTQWICSGYKTLNNKRPKNKTPNNKTAKNKTPYATKAQCNKTPNYKTTNFRS